MAAASSGVKAAAPINGIASHATPAGKISTPPLSSSLTPLKPTSATVAAASPTAASGRSASFKDAVTTQPASPGGASAARRDGPDVEMRREEETARSGIACDERDERLFLFLSSMERNRTVAEVSGLREAFVVGRSPLATSRWGTSTSRDLEFAEEQERRLIASQEESSRNDVIVGPFFYLKAVILAVVQQRKQVESLSNRLDAAVSRIADHAAQTNALVASSAAGHVEATRAAIDKSMSAFVASAANQRDAGSSSNVQPDELMKRLEFLEMILSPAVHADNGMQGWGYSSFVDASISSGGVVPFGAKLRAVQVAEAEARDDIMSTHRSLWREFVSACSDFAAVVLGSRMRSQHAESPPSRNAAPSTAQGRHDWPPAADDGGRHRSSQQTPTFRPRAATTRLPSPPSVEPSSHDLHGRATATHPAMASIFKARTPERRAAQNFLELCGLLDWQELLLDNGFTSVEALCAMTMDDLKELGVALLGQRRDILRRISQGGNDLNAALHRREDLATASRPIPAPSLLPAAASPERTEGHAQPAATARDGSPSSPAASAKVSSASTTRATLSSPAAHVDAHADQLSPNRQLASSSSRGPSASSSAVPQPAASLSVHDVSRRLQRWQALLRSQDHRLLRDWESARSVNRGESSSAALWERAWRQASIRDLQRERTWDVQIGKYLALLQAAGDSSKVVEAEIPPPPVIPESEYIQRAGAAWQLEDVRGGSGPAAGVSERLRLIQRRLAGFDPSGSP